MNVSKEDGVNLVLTSLFEYLGQRKNVVGSWFPWSNPQCYSISTVFYQLWEYSMRSFYSYSVLLVMFLGPFSFMIQIQAVTNHWFLVPHQELLWIVSVFDSYIYFDVLFLLWYIKRRFVGNFLNVLPCLRLFIIHLWFLT